MDFPGFIKIPDIVFRTVVAYSHQKEFTKRIDFRNADEHVVPVPVTNDHVPAFHSRRSEHDVHTWICPSRDYVITHRHVFSDLDKSLAATPRIQIRNILLSFISGQVSLYYVIQKSHNHFVFIAKIRIKNDNSKQFLYFLLVPL